MTDEPPGVARTAPHPAADTGKWEKKGEVTFKYVEASGGAFIPAHPGKHWYGETGSHRYHERASRFWKRWFDRI